MKRLLKWVGLGLLGLILVVAGPILFVETACRGTALPQKQAQWITEETRPEARTYMVYPEWHIVYAYEGYAEALREGHPHDFPYLSAIAGFWSSLCGLTEKADELGEAGFASKATIYTIGASFTLEMLFKAAYEETIGRIATLGAPSAQDEVEARMAADYATFLQQVPWYKYDFPSWNHALDSRARRAERMGGAHRARDRMGREGTICKADRQSGRRVGRGRFADADCGARVIARWA